MPTDTPIDTIDLFRGTPYGDKAYEKLTKRLGVLPRNFRFYSAGWIGKTPSEWEVMELRGAEFREAKTGPNKGRPVIIIKGTERQVFVTEREVNADATAVPFAVASMPLTYTETARGFPLITFKDRYEAKCSLQKSSLAFEDCIWLGIDDANPLVMASDAASVGVQTTETTGWIKYPIPLCVSLSTRMHLTREQVATLLPVLKLFVETGEITS